MSDMQTDPRPRIASLRDTDELIRNLGRFPKPVLPVGLLRELQSRGDAIHDSLAELIGQAIESVEGGGHASDSVFFAFALLVPMANKDDRRLIERLLTLPDKSVDLLIGSLLIEGMPRFIANSFKEESASEWIDWIDRLADHPKLRDINSSSLFRAMTLAVAAGHLDREIAIDVLVNRLKKRADQRFDLQSAFVVCELIDISAHTSEEVDAVVRACFHRKQIDTGHVGIESWNEASSNRLFRINENRWIDPIAELSSRTYEYLSEDLDPINATCQISEQANLWSRSIASSVPALIAQLRRSTNTRFPREALKSIDRGFASAYYATIDLIREEVTRYQSDSDSWSGNGAYLGLVLTVANLMPLPTDLLEAILQMPQADRERVFGDQFDLIVQALALTPLQKHDFIEQWIWDADRCYADRRDMVDFYSNACHYMLFDRELAIDALVAGLQRALLEEPLLIAPYAENLASLSPRQQVQELDEAFRRDDVEWFVPLQNLRRMVQDVEFASDQFYKDSRKYRDVIQTTTAGVMFDLDLLEEKPRSMPTRVYQPPQEFSSSTSIRKVTRTPRNALCPCGSGKKFKKCCLNNA